MNNKLGSSDYPRSLGRKRALGFHEHLTFFDSYGDGKITLRETQKGLARLGFGNLSSASTALTIHAGLAGLGLLQGRLVDPLVLPLSDTNSIRHPDTRFVNKAGEFDEARVHELFSLHGREFNGEALSLVELTRLIAASLVDTSPSFVQALWRVPVGLAAAVAEWGVLSVLADRRRNGKLVLEKETVIRFYTDPRLLHDLAQHIASERERRGRTLAGSARNLVQNLLM